MEKKTGMQNSGRCADDDLMSRSTRRHIVAVSVVAALSLFVVACGQDDLDLTAAIEEQTSQTTGVAPDREADDVPLTDTGRAVFDEAQELFNSSVGSSYVMTFDLISRASAEGGLIRVEVADGRVVNVTYPDAISEQILPEIPMLTVADFFERARSVLADGGGVEAELDEFYGHPLTMTLDPVPNAIDDEMTIVVQSLEPVEAAPESNY